MSEVNNFENVGGDDYPRDSRFDTSVGAAGIAIRQTVYFCLGPGIKPPDYPTEVIDALRYAGVSPSAEVVDIGCSYPYDLREWLLSGQEKGRVKGIDPFPKQFMGLPYLRPRGSREEYLALLTKGDQQALANFFHAVRGSDKATEFEGITLFEAEAKFVPLPTSSVDVAQTMFSAQQIQKEDLEASWQEILRVLKKPEQYDGSGQQSGIVAGAFSDWDNKIGMHRDEVDIAALMGKIVGEEVLPPKPLQAGYTSENALEDFTQLGLHVYYKSFEQDIHVNDTTRPIIRAAHETLNGEYILKNDGRRVDTKIFRRALDTVVPLRGQPYVDKMRRKIVMASKRPIDLPVNEYVRVA